jgi:hypothetical protein
MKNARRTTLALLAAALCAAPAQGHIVYGGPTLHQLVADAEVVARARIAGGDELWVVPLAVRRPVVDAELVEVWKGGLSAGPVRFAQHGHGVATFEAGDEVVVFLRSARRSPELELLASAGALDWVSLQEHDDEWKLEPGTRDAVASAVQGYASLERVGDPARRVAGLHQLTLELLAQGEPRLASSALQDLVRAGDALKLTRDDLLVLTPLVEDPRPPIGLRAGVLAELARRGLAPGDAPWVRLVDGARAADLPAAVRAAGAHPGPAVTARLAQVLESGDAAAAESAAVALGSPGNTAAVEPLARALARGDARLRMAAIRGLGRIGTPDARAALSAAASGNDDPAARRRAVAELRVLESARTP